MKRKYLYIGLAVLVAILVGIIAYYNIANKDRWYNNTTINGIDVSGLTLQQSKDKIQKSLDGYTLTIKGRNNGTMTIDGDDINYKATVSKKIENAFSDAHKGISFPFKSYSYSLVHDVTYNASKLANVINKSELVKGSKTYKVKAPRPVYIAYSTSKKSYQVNDAEPGNTIDTDGLTKAVVKSFKSVSKTLDISTSKYNSCYKTAKETASRSELQNRLAAYNNKGLRYITWTIAEGHTETMTPDDIAKMLYWANGKVAVNDEKLQAYVEKLCLKYKTVGQKRTYTSHTGKKLSTTEGDYGWRVDYAKAIAQARQAMNKAIPQDSTDAYVKDQSEDNIKAVTLKYDLPWYSKSTYKINWNNFKDDWDQKNYTEVDLGAQMVYVFRNGKVAYSTPCISGKPVPGRKTTTGAFFIKEHQMNRTLIGENYQTPVKYWVRITWTGTGFHAAPWQSWGSWSPSYYKSRGSHGCINLSMGSAAKMYSITKYGEMVFMHY